MRASLSPLPFLACLASLTLGACNPTGQTCTTVDCESSATITFDRALSDGYLLIVSAGGQDGTAECNAPPSPTASAAPSLRT